MRLHPGNGVGYQQQAVEKGYSIITPAFVNVAGGDYEIDKLILNGVDDGDASVQVVNDDGTWGTWGTWLNAYGEYPAGWFTDISGETPAAITLKPGQAVFFKTASDNTTVLSAGQVSETIKMDLPIGYSMLGNTSPVPLAIDSLTLEGVNDGDASVQIVNSDGTWGTWGTWLNAYEEYPAGWFTDISGETAADIVLQPGQAIFFKTTSKGAKAVIPSALVK